MIPHSKNIRTILRNSGQYLIERHNIKGNITIIGYREYDTHCECDVTFTGKFLNSRGRYFNAEWIDSNQISPQQYSLRKVRSLIRNSSNLTVKKILKFFTSGEKPIKIKKVDII